MTNDQGPHMISVNSLLFLALFLSNNLVFCSTPRDLKPEVSHQDSKRGRRVVFSAEAIIADELQSMSLSTSAAIEPEYTDPLLAFCNSQIPNLTDRERTSMFDEAVCNFNFGMIKLFKKHGLIQDMVDPDHLQRVCRSTNEVSEEILEYLINNSDSAVNEVTENLSDYLLSCFPHGLDKFKFLWTKFNGTDLDIASLSRIVSKITTLNEVEYYDYVFGSLFRWRLEKLDILLIQALVYSANYLRVESVHFLIEIGLVPVSHLDLNLKIKIMLAAVKSNNLFITRLILEDANVLARIVMMNDSPWIDAINRDQPEIVDAFLTALPNHINSRKLSIYAVSNLSVKVLNLFKEKGILTDSLLFKMAQSAFYIDSIDAFELVVQLGFDVNTLSSDNNNILTLAVNRNSVQIIEFLLKTCQFDPNTVNEQFDNETNIITTFTAIHCAKSAEAVRQLASNGADVNAKFIERNHLGEIIKSTSALHKAAEAGNISMFRELVIFGADITIPNQDGNTNEEFYSRIGIKLSK